MEWSPFISIILAVCSLILSIYKVRSTKEQDKAKEIIARFDRTEEKIDKFATKIGVLEERLNTEIQANTKNRDRLEAKIEELIKIVYRSLG